MKRLLGAAVLSAAPLLARGEPAPAQDAKIYECTVANGQVVYQDDPCPEVVPVPVAPKAPSKPKVAKPPSAKKPPAPATKPQPPAAAATPQFVARPIVIPRTPASASRPQEPARYCGPVDARWATPEKALQTFIAAVQSGDRALVLACLTGDALVDLGPDLAELPLEKLRETVDSFTGYVSEGDLGPFFSIRALRAGTRPKWIFFERIGSGEWRIGGI